LRHALSSLPSSLDGTYRRILESIEEEEQMHVRRILQWLCFSKRPLRIEEIAVIYQVADRIRPPFACDDGLFRPEDIIGICRGLLSLSFTDTDNERRAWHHFPPSNLQIVQLAHFSVKEYLFSSLSSPWTIDKDLSHVTILKSAIAYYLHFMTLHDIQSLSHSDLVLKYSLAEYFVKYLRDHLTPVKEHSDLLQSLQLLLHPPSAPISTELGILLLKPGNLWDEPISELVACDPATNLYLAIQLQSLQVCQSILAMNVCLDLARPLYSCQLPPVGQPPLVEAVRYGKREIIQVLLDAHTKHHYIGLDPLADGSALEEAVKKCDTPVVHMLLTTANDIQKTMSWFGRSLYLALADPTGKGHPVIVKMLVDAGVDVNAGDGWALHWASFEGNEEAVHILIEAGADVNIKSCNGETALETASRFGHVKIIKMLLGAGADVGIGCGWALYFASFRGDEEVVRVLSEACAAVNLKVLGQMALDKALHCGHAKIVQILLNAGATRPPEC
jgi:ankyrin repeat protein